MIAVRSTVVLRLLAPVLTVATGWTIAASPASASAARAVPEPAEVVRTDVSFRSGDLTIRATVIAPATARAGARRPGTVLVHGSGAGTPRERLVPIAEAFAGRGLVTLVYDKRAAGYTPSRRDFSQLADDALAAAALLRTRPEVDPAKVGLWGVSEGGWVVPIAAARAPDLAFVVVIGANGVPPARQQAWALREHTRRAGVSSSGQNRFGVTVVRLLAEADMFAQAHHDPVPVLARVRSPLLAVWGAQDHLTPPGEALTIFRDVLSGVGHPSYALRVFAQGNHGISRSRAGVGEDRRNDFVPGYPELVATWVDDVTSGAAPAPGADPAPAQALPSPVIRPMPSWASPGIQLAAFGFFTVAFLAYPLTGAAGWIRRRLRSRRVPADDAVPSVKAIGPPRAARWLAALGLTASAGFLAYFVWIVAMAPVGPVLLGRSLPWLALQALAVAVLVALMATAWSWLRTGGPAGVTGRGRLALLLAGGSVLVAWMAFWGLLSA